MVNSGLQWLTTVMDGCRQKFPWQRLKTSALGASVLGLAIATQSVPASAQRSPTSLTDINDHWARLCIQHLYHRGVVQGYPDNTFRPNEPVSRTEFAALVNRAFPDLPERVAAKDYRDLDETYWGLVPIDRATATGFMTGYPDNRFDPTKKIPRYEVLLALVAGLGYQPQSDPQTLIPQYYEDAAALPAFAYRAIAAATERQLVVNYPDVHRLEPQQWASRAEVATFLCRALDTTGTVPTQYIVGDRPRQFSPTPDRPDNLPTLRP